jgi:hypothetical protein
MKNLNLDQNESQLIPIFGGYMVQYELLISLFLFFKHLDELKNTYDSNADGDDQRESNIPDFIEVKVFLIIKIVLW